MEVSLESIQELAPDQSSLSAAKKLLKKQKWPSVGQSEAHKTIWGMCQGSGSKPYYTMADLSNLGYKCTCPSRKFPCKHVLALLWQYSEQLHDFQEQELPQWVLDWHGRRRKTSPSQASTSTSSKSTDNSVNKSIDKIIDADHASTESTATEINEKSEAQKRKRAESLKAKTDALISAGLEELQQWMEDQLRSGISQFLKDSHSRCRNISARLIDSKASNLGVTLDELPAKILEYPIEEQPSIVVREFGRLVLLCNAWFTDNNDLDARRAIASAEKKDQLLSANTNANTDTNTNAVSGIWQTIGEQSYTRRDGLITQTTWLLNINSSEPQFAKLVDHFPAASGRKMIGAGFKSCVHGDIVFYPSRVNLRGVLQNYEIIPKPSESLWPATSQRLPTQFLTLQSQIPWLDNIPFILADGRIAVTKEGEYWWQSNNLEEHYLLTNNTISSVLLGCEIERAFILWDGSRALLLSAVAKQWGAMSC
ncbi:SWIM zinc finger family protein [Sessilibacter corallicola]|uniref:SWIM zinc finger family protein n=1 Tax=Sessilibacter corallicola TaxID=2904075 RepID=A0ABQ0A7C2_9GAMM